MTDRNILVADLPRLESPKEIISGLNHTPPSPDEVRSFSPGDRVSRFVPQIENIFIVGRPQFLIAEMIRNMLYEHYHRKDPGRPENVKGYYYESIPSYSKSIAGLVDGMPGVGKSKAISKALNLFPQTFTHERFPHFKGEYVQIVWFSFTMRSHTRKGFATELVQAWNDVFINNDLPQPISTSDIEGANVDRLINLFVRSALVHNLGLIHIDEIQNLFLSHSSPRTTKLDPTRINPRDDITLSKILGLFNIGLPILLSCTPDGTRGLSQRGSISQRFGCNYVNIHRYKTAEDKYFKEFVSKLMDYQYTDDALPFTTHITSLFHEYSAGIPRVIVDCFVEAQRRALTIGKRHMEIKDIHHAFDRLPSDLRKSIQALHNEDYNHLSKKPDYL